MEQMMLANGLWNTLRTHDHIYKKRITCWLSSSLFISISFVMNSSIRETPHYRVYAASAHEWCSWLQ